MKPRLAMLACLAAGAAMAADQAMLERGQKEEVRDCTACHSLRLVNSQRLSKATWNKELDKMSGWGTKIRDREALLEYLADHFGDDKPVPKPDTSADGTAKKH